MNKNLIEKIISTVASLLLVQAILAGLKAVYAAVTEPRKVKNEN